LTTADGEILNTVEVLIRDKNWYRCFEGWYFEGMVLEPMHNGDPDEPPAKSVVEEVELTDMKSYEVATTNKQSAIKKKRMNAQMRNKLIKY
jgi:hypothetical protein